MLSHGPNLPLFINPLGQNQLSAFLRADVIVSSLVLCAFIYRETRKLRAGQYTAKVSGLRWGVQLNALTSPTVLRYTPRKRKC